MSSGRLVIVDGKGGRSHRWSEGLADLNPEIVATLDDAGRLTADDIVILDSSEPVRDVEAKTMLAAAHEQLQRLLRDGARRRASRRARRPARARR